MFQRLKSFPIREQISEDDQAETSEEPLIFTGAIYGLQIDAISEQAVVVNVTGRPLPAKDKDDGKSHDVEPVRRLSPGE